MVRAGSLVKLGRHRVEFVMNDPDGSYSDSFEAYSVADATTGHGRSYAEAAARLLVELEART